jgi:hypothetical protein
MSSWKIAVISLLLFISLVRGVRDVRVVRGVRGEVLIFLVLLRSEVNSISKSI